MASKTDDISKSGGPKFLRLDPESRHKMWKKARLAAFILVILIFVGFVFGGESGVLALYRYSRYEKTLRRRLAKEKARTDSLQQVLTKLRSDPDFQERTAREKLRLIKDGEIIYRFESDD